MPPGRLDRSLTDWTPMLDGNDALPDCTFVSPENLARGIASLNDYDLAVANGSAPAAYAACFGKPLAEIAATDGIEMLAVVAWQGLHGFDVGEQVPLVVRVGTVALNRMALAHAMDRLDGVWAGVRLFERDMEAIFAGQVLDVQDGRDDGALIGLHAENLWCYDRLADDAVVQAGTWGRWQGATWRWYRDRSDEAHAAVFRQLARADGFYAGVTADGLETKL